MKKVVISLFIIMGTLIPSLLPAKELPKIAVWDLEARNTPATHAKELTSILVSEITTLKNFEVFSQENVRTLAGFTSERMMLGCTDTKCLTALGQMDIAKLISGSVAKIGSVYSISLNLFDTQNAKAENAVSEFCRTEEELIVMVQRGVRKLLGAPVEPSAFLLPPPEKSAAAPAPATSGWGSLEINSKIRGAQVYLGTQNLGEAPVRVMNIAAGPQEVKVEKKGYAEWRQQIQLQPNERKVIDVNLKRLMLEEDYLVDKIFYFEKCAFGWDKFDYFIRFQKEGRLEGTPRSGSRPEKVSRQDLDFGRLDGRWSLEKNKIVIEFMKLKGVSPRRIMKMEIDVSPDHEDVFPTRCESSTEYRLAGGNQSQTWDGKTDIDSCQTRELR